MLPMARSSLPNDIPHPAPQIGRLSELVGVGEGRQKKDEWGIGIGKEVEQDQAVWVYLDNQLETLTLIKRIKKNMIYGRNLAKNPATKRNMMIFSINLLILDFFFAIASPFD